MIITEEKTDKKGKKLTLKKYERLCEDRVKIKRIESKCKILQPLPECSAYVTNVVVYPCINSTLYDKIRCTRTNFCLIISFECRH